MDDIRINSIDYKAATGITTYRRRIGHYNAQFNQLQSLYLLLGDALLHHRLSLVKTPPIRFEIHSPHRSTVSGLRPILTKEPAHPDRLIVCYGNADVSNTFLRIFSKVAR